jgi:transcriptional regulator with XRE-family HTH domain
MPLRKKAIGLRLKEARLAAGMSVVDVAARINRSRASVHAWEAGESMPELLMFAELATLYGARADALLGAAVPHPCEGILLKVFGRPGAPADRTRTSGPAF